MRHARCELLARERKHDASWFQIFTICRQLGLIDLSVTVNYALVFAREHTAAISSAQDDTLAIPNI